VPVLHTCKSGSKAVMPVVFIPFWVVKALVFAVVTA